MAAVLNWIDQTRGLIGGLLWGGVLVSLLLVIAPVLRHWRARRKALLNDPHRLLDPPPRPTGLYLAACLIAALTIGLGLLADAPMPIWGAAVACLAVAHLTRWGRAAWLGLLAVFAGFVAWGALLVPDSPRGGWILGAAVAALFFALAARFWQRQLDEGRSWTTTGWLVPYCDTLAIAAGAVALLNLVLMR